MVFSGNPNGFGGPLGVPSGNPMQSGPPLNPRPQPAGAGFNLALPGPSVTAVDPSSDSSGRRFSQVAHTVMMNPSSKLASGKCCHCSYVYASTS